MARPLPSWVGQSLRFGLVAPVIFLVDWGLLTLLVLTGIPSQLGRIGSLAGSVVVGFLLNRFFTFRASGRPTLAEARRYGVAAGLGIAVNYGVFVVATWMGAPHAPAIAAGMLAAALVTFVRFRAAFGASKS